MPPTASQHKLQRKQLQDFIDDIAKDQKAGYRFVPFIGSGISKPAGYPLVSELNQSYLPFCVAKALGIDPFDKNMKRDESSVRWTPRSGVWPDIAIETVARLARRVTNEGIRETLDKVHQFKKGQLDFRSWIARRASAALSNWQTALGFLSEIVDESHLQNTSTKSARERQITLTAPDSAVIDSFFRYLNTGKVPSLGHRMLQALSNVLRFNVLLTTNFDELIERSFAAVRSPLEVFDVPSTATLPDAELVIAQRSLIKMHGGHFGVRADGSVDTPPGIQDTDNFLGYLAGRKLKPGESRGQKQFKDLIAILVVDASGEGRIRFLLHLAADVFKNLHVYWIAHGSHANDLTDLRRDFGACSQGVSHPQPDLLLLELYQHLTNSVPTAGVVFPGMWELPMPPIIGPTGEKPITKQFKTARQRIHDAIKVEWRKKEARRPVVVKMEGAHRGGVALCAEVFAQFRQEIKNLREQTEEPGKNSKHQRMIGDQEVANCRPVWIDLDQVGRPAGIFLRLTLLAAKMNGDPDPISALDIRLFDNSFKVAKSRDVGLRQRFYEAVCSALMLTFASPQGGERLLVFLNAQEGCGLDSPFANPAADLESKIADLDHGTERRSPMEWEKGEIIDAALCLISKLNAEDQCGVQFVFIVREAVATEDNRLEKLIRENTRPLRDQIEKKGWPAVVCKEQCSPFEPTKVSKLACEWVKSGKDQIRLRWEFLWLLTLFRHARYPAGLLRIMRNLQWDRDRSTLPDIDKWLEDLHKDGVIRFKPGGFVWLHPGLKVLIRKELLQLAPKREWDARRQAFEIEFQIARWYGRLLLASADPMAAVESAFHSLHAIQTCLESDGCCDAKAAQFAIEHSTQVIKLAFPLFECRITDHFAGQALANLQSRLQQVQEKLKRPSPKLLNAISKMRRILQDQRGDLYLREGEFEQFSNPQPPLRDNNRGENAKGSGRQDAFFERSCDLREAGVAVLLRRFKVAETKFAKLWSAIVGRSYIEKKVKDVERHALTRARVWLADKMPCEQMKAFVAKLARWNLQFEMHRAQTRYLIGKLRGQPNSNRALQRSKAAKRALWFYSFGVEVLRHATDIGDGMVWQENARLRAHAALYYLIADQSATDTQRMLDDAESFLDEFPLKEASVVRIIIQLRRAEAKIVEAGKDVKFAKFREKLRNPQSRARLKPVPIQRMQRVLGLSTDALACLEIAEAELRRHSKSRWWWWTFVVLKMKVMEYFYTCRLWRKEPIGETAKIIPNQAVNFFWGGVCQLVEARQMRDIFFLSRTVWAYAQTAKAHTLFHLHRIGGPQHDFKSRIARVIDHLNRLDDRLKDALKSDLFKDNDVDKDVLRYAKECQQAGEAVKGFLGNLKTRSGS